MPLWESGWARSDGAGSAGRGLPAASLQAPADYAGLYATWNVDGDGAATIRGTSGRRQHPALSLNVDSDLQANWQEDGDINSAPAQR